MLNEYQQNFLPHSPIFAKLRCLNHRELEIQSQVRTTALSLSLSLTFPCVGEKYDDIILAQIRISEEGLVLGSIKFDIMSRSLLLKSPNSRWNGVMSKTALRISVIANAFLIGTYPSVREKMRALAGTKDIVCDFETARRR